MDSIFLLSESVFIIILFVFNSPFPSWIIMFLVEIFLEIIFVSSLKFYKNNYINLHLFYHYFLIYLKDIELECFLIFYLDYI